MPLFGPPRPPPFEPFKLKTYLKCAIQRIKQLHQKKDNEAKKMAKEIGALLNEGNGKEEMARIKVEHVIRNKNDVHALEIVELFCDLLLARLMLLESEANPRQPGMNMCPVELQEAVFSVCWAAPRTEVAELQHATQQFKLLYPRHFGLDPATGRPSQMMDQRGQIAPAHEAPLTQVTDTAVNAKLREYLSVTVPPKDKVIEYLETIGSVYAPEWECPQWLRDGSADLINTEDFLTPAQFEPGWGQPPDAFNPGAAAPALAAQAVPAFDSSVGVQQPPFLPPVVASRLYRACLLQRWGRLLSWVCCRGIWRP
jgi:hypothetical protein